MSTSGFYSPDTLVEVKLWNDHLDAYLEVSCYGVTIPVSLYQIDDLIEKLTIKKKELENCNARCK